MRCLAGGEALVEDEQAAEVTSSRLTTPFGEAEPPKRRLGRELIVDRIDALLFGEDLVRKSGESLTRDVLKALSDELEPRPIIRRTRVMSREGIWHAAHGTLHMKNSCLRKMNVLIPRIVEEGLDHLLDVDEVLGQLSSP